MLLMSILVTRPYVGNTADKPRDDTEGKIIDWPASDYVNMVYNTHWPMFDRCCCE